ncbi:MAG: preprotein translocase subunit SecE [Spirochaetaceae bacterium]|nr:preprotein translocase subunit SecE [Spirochaetaceae bacterium]
MGKMGRFTGRIAGFFKESYSELKKVIWPSRADVAASTKVVIVTTIIFALLLGAVDFLLIIGVDLIF